MAYTARLKEAVRLTSDLIDDPVKWVHRTLQLS